MPVSGYVITSAANSPFKFFKTFTVPMLVPPDKALRHTAADAHEWAFWILAGLLVLHAGAALRHHFLLKNDVLVRMLPGPGRRKMTQETKP
jgi:cytochrome b561